MYFSLFIYNGDLISESALKNGQVRDTTHSRLGLEPRDLPFSNSKI